MGLVHSPYICGRTAGVEWNTIGDLLNNGQVEAPFLARLSIQAKKFPTKSLKDCVIDEYRQCRYLPYISNRKVANENISKRLGLPPQGLEALWKINLDNNKYLTDDSIGKQFSRSGSSHICIIYLDLNLLPDADPDSDPLKL